MKRTPITLDLDAFPSVFHPLLTDTPVYDSSCSVEARVYYIDRDRGYFLKVSPKGTLAREAELTRYFHKRGLGAEVLAYEALESDYLLTARIMGEDGTHPDYLADPKRLSTLIGELLRALHECDPSGCPLPTHTEHYCATAEKNYRRGCFDPTYIYEGMDISTAEQAWRFAQENKCRLKSDTLLHGDYCLPNIMLNGWRPSGFIDLGGGGIGDRHIDLFWGIWTLRYNLGTDRYAERFLDAYGRDQIDREMLGVVSVFEAFG